MSDEGLKTIATALGRVMEKCAYVQKTKKNAFHGYTYAGEGDVLAVLRPAMVEEGLMFIPSCDYVSDIDQYGNITVTVEYTLIHRDGHIWPQKIKAAGCGNDKNKNGIGDKGLYKALTGANKYLLFKMFQIETGDDPERDDPPPPPRVPAPDRDVANTCLQKVGEFTDIGELKAWWEKTKEMLPSYDIVNDLNHPGGPTYASIVDAVKKRALILQHPPKTEEPKQLPKPELNDDIPF